MTIKNREDRSDRITMGFLRFLDIAATILFITVMVMILVKYIILG